MTDYLHSGANKMNKVEAYKNDNKLLLADKLGHAKVSSLKEQNLLNTIATVQQHSNKITQLEIDVNKVRGAYVYKGTVETEFDLPLNNNSVGDVYNVSSTGMNYAWTGENWDELGSSFSSNIATTTTILENFYDWTIEIQPVLSTVTLEDTFNGNYLESNQTFRSSKHILNFLTNTVELVFLYQPDIESKAFITLSMLPVSFDEEIIDANSKEFYGIIDLTPLSNNYSTSETIALYEYDEENDVINLSSFTAQIELFKSILWQNFQSIRSYITLNIPETLHISSSITESFASLLDFLNNSNIGIDKRQLISSPQGIYEQTSAIIPTFSHNSFFTTIRTTTTNSSIGNTQTFSLNPLQDTTFSLTLTKSNNIFTFDLDQHHPQNILISFNLYLANPSSYSITFPNNVQWPDNNLPSFSTFNNMVLNFSTVDYGTTWYGVVKFKN